MSTSTRPSATAGRRRGKRSGRLALLLAGLTTTGVAVADDYQDATRLREAGEILPLQQVLERFHAQQPARVLEVELKQRRDRYYYEIEYLDEGGRVREQEYDATSGELLRDQAEP